MYGHHKFDHEFDGAPAPHTSYVVCSLPRSGSSVLCELLCNSGLAGAPTEFFDRGHMERFGELWNAPYRDSYLRELLRRKTSPNGVFGLKLHYHQMMEFLGDLDLREVLPGLRWIYIRRNDRLRQAISFARAIQTERWASNLAGNGSRETFDFQQINELQDQIVTEEASWKRFFQLLDITPMEIEYESLLLDPLRVTRRALAFLGVDLDPATPIPAPTLERQADRITERWVRTHQAIERHGEVGIWCRAWIEVELALTAAGLLRPART